MTDEALIQRFDRIERKLSALLVEKKKATWVKVKAIMQYTGWDRVQLRRMRENGLIEHKKNNTGIWYLVESVDKTLIRHNENTNTRAPGVDVAGPSNPEKVKA